MLVLFHLETDKQPVYVNAIYVSKIQTELWHDRFQHKDRRHTIIYGAGSPVQVLETMEEVVEKIGQALSSLSIPLSILTAKATNDMQQKADMDRQTNLLLGTP